MTGTPAVGVVIPVRNMPRHIGACVSSVIGQLDEGDELVVVDDGSTDDSARVAAAAGARVIRNAGPAGPYGARNYGAGHVDTKALLFVDARCRAQPGLVDAHRRLLGTPGTVLSCTEVEIVLGRSLASRIAVAQDSWRVDFKVKGTVFDFYPTANLGVRRDAFDAVHGFRQVRSGADADLCWRIQLAGLGSLGVDRATLLRWIPRDKLWQFIEQNYRYGRSSVYLDRLYADVRAQHPEPVSSAPAPTARPAPDRLAAAGAHLINVPFRLGRLRGRREHRAVQPDPELTALTGRD